MASKHELKGKEGAANAEAQISGGKKVKMQLRVGSHTHEAELSKSDLGLLENLNEGGIHLIGDLRFYKAGDELRMSLIEPDRKNEHGYWPISYDRFASALEKEESG